jgi:hypothetical protein
MASRADAVGYAVCISRNDTGYDRRRRVISHHIATGLVVQLPEEIML